MIRYSPQAAADIDSIWDIIYSVSENYEIADNYINGIISAIEEKDEFPKSGSPLIYRGLFTGFYSVLYKKYLVFYRIRDEQIEVARVLFAASDYLKILFGDVTEE